MEWQQNKTTDKSNEIKKKTRKKREECEEDSVGLTEDVGADGRDQVAHENQRQGRQHERHLELPLHHDC
jgi:hypothetical protein